MLPDRKNHLYGINIQSLAFLRKKLKLKQYLMLKTCNLLSVQRVERFSQQTAECFLSISRLAGLGTQQTVEYITQLISFWWYCFTNLAQVASTPLLIWHRWQQSNPEGSGITKNLSGYLRAWCIWSWKMRIADRSFQSFHPF